MARKVPSVRTSVATLSREPIKHHQHSRASSKTRSSIWLSYARDKSAWQAAEELISSSALSFSEISQLIDTFSAADELFSHILFEVFLEVYGPVEDFKKLNRTNFKSTLVRTGKVDWLLLYEYVDELFDSRPLQELLPVSICSFQMYFNKCQA